MPSPELMQAAGDGARRGGRRAGSRRGPCGSSAARATTAATARSPPASWPAWVSHVEAAAGSLGRGRRDLDAWLAGSGAVVDAIFGTGFAGAPREPAAAAIEAINRCGAPVVACDIASGVDASSGEVEGVAVEADLTVSFHAAKLGQRIAPGKWHTGELRVAPIGIPAGAPGSRAAARSTLACWRWRRAAGRGRPSSARARWRSPAARAGLTGAVRMSSTAAIRAGAGYATVAVPADLEPSSSSRQPEVMSVGCPGGDGCLAPASAERRARRLRARRRRRARARAGPRSRVGRAGPRGGRRDRGAAGDRRRRPQRLRRAGSSWSPPAKRRRSSPRTPASSGACSSATPRDRRPPSRRRPRGRRGRAAPSSSSRATTRSSPTALASPSTRSPPRPGHRRQRRRPLGDHRGAAGTRPGAVRGGLRCGCRATPAPAATPRLGSARPSR